MPALKADIEANGSPFLREFAKIKGEVAKGAGEIANSFRGMFLGALGAEALRRLVTEVFTDATKIQDTAKAYGITTQEVVGLMEAAERAGVPLETVLGKLTDLKAAAESQSLMDVAQSFDEMADGAGDAARQAERIAKASEALKGIWESIKGAAAEAVVFASLLGTSASDIRAAQTNVAGRRSGQDIAGLIARGGGQSAGLGFGNPDALQRVGAFIGGDGGVTQTLQRIAASSEQTATNTAQIAATATPLVTAADLASGKYLRF